MRASSLAFAVAAALCLVGHLAILRSVIRARASASDPNVPRPRLGIEVFWAVLPAVILALVLTATWERVRDRDHARPHEVMKVAR